MTEPSYVLHPGLPRTGTTSIQSSIWSRSPNYAGWQPWRHRELADRFRDLVREDQPDTTGLLDGLERSRTDPDLPVVVSYESGTWQTFAATGSSLYRVDGWERARRFRSLLPEDTIVLLTVREQRSWLLSTFRFLVEMGCTDPISEFLTEHEALLGTREPGGCDFTAAVDVYAEQFGADQVHVVPLEAIVARSDLAWSTMADALGMPLDELPRDHFPHERRTQVSLPLGAFRAINGIRRHSGYRGPAGAEWRRIRPVLRRAQVPVLSRRSLARAALQIDDFVRSFPEISASNQRLATESGYPLDRYGYL